MSYINNRKDMSILVPLISSSCVITLRSSEMPTLAAYVSHIIITLFPHSSLCVWSHCLHFQTLYPDERGSCSTFVSGSLMRCVYTVAHSRKPLDVLVYFYLATFSYFNLVVNQSCFSMTTLERRKSLKQKEKTKEQWKEKHSHNLFTLTTWIFLKTIQWKR